MEGYEMDKTQQSNILGTEPVKKLLIKLAIPAITAQLVNMLYTLVDRVYIGRIEGVGTQALTGVGVTMPIIMIISAFSALIGMGGAPRAAIKMGEQDVKGAEKILGNCFTTLLCISVALTIFFLIFGESLLYTFGASEYTIPYAIEYLNIYVIGTIFVQFALGLNPFISTQGFAKISMLTVVIGAVTNIVLDPIFIFVFDMGVSGAALATILSQAISATWVLLFLFGKKTTLKIRRENMAIKASVILPVLALGVSPFIMQSTESILNITFNSSLQTYGGDIAVGAMTICSSIMMFIMLPTTGISQGAQPITSYNYGARNPERVRESFRLLRNSVLTYVTVFWLALMIVPQFFAGIFSPDAELVEYTAWALRIYLFGAFMFGIQLACQQTLVSLGQAKLSMFLALLRKVILLIPLILIIPQFLPAEYKVLGVLIAEPISDIIAASITGILFKFRFNKLMGQMTPTDAQNN